MSHGNMDLSVIFKKTYDVINVIYIIYFYDGIIYISFIFGC